MSQAIKINETSILRVLTMTAYKSAVTIISIMTSIKQVVLNTLRYNLWKSTSKASYVAIEGMSFVKLLCKVMKYKLLVATMNVTIAVYTSYLNLKVFMNNKIKDKQFKEHYLRYEFFGDDDIFDRTISKEKRYMEDDDYKNVEELINRRVNKTKILKALFKSRQIVVNRKRVMSPLIKLIEKEQVKANNRQSEILTELNAGN